MPGGWPLPPDTRNAAGRPNAARAAWMPASPGRICRRCGQKHLRELMDSVRCGERAAMFYLGQRPDGHCCGPADVVDPAYAALFYEAMDAGVEIYPYRASVSPAGIELEGLLPVAPRPAGL